MKKIILASTSPYRKELLARLSVPFDCENPGIDEEQFKTKLKNPVELCQTLAKLKAEAVALKKRGCIVIGSDQLGHLEGTILGKPHTFEKAVEQLLFMSGKTHELLTAVFITDGKTPIAILNHTVLKMRNLSQVQIENYVKLDSPLDCVGSYKLEKAGITLFEKIQTDDFSAIIGLPLMEVTSALIKFGISIP